MGAIMKQELATIDPSIAVEVRGRGLFLALVIRESLGTTFFHATIGTLNHPFLSLSQV